MHGLFTSKCGPWSPHIAYDEKDCIGRGAQSQLLSASALIHPHPAYRNICCVHSGQSLSIFRGPDTATMPSISIILATAAAAYFFSFIYKLARNFINAKRSGLPYIVIPWDQNHLVWIITCVPLRPWFKRNLPTWLWNRVTLCIYGWEFHEKLRPHKEYIAGELSYVHVGCGNFEFWTSDPEFVTQILGRPNDFVQFELANLFVRA